MYLFECLRLFISKHNISNNINQKNMGQEINLTTERLIIRTPQVEDAQNIFMLMSDEETAFNTGFSTMTNSSEAEGKIRRGIANMNMFVITTKEEPAHTIGVFEVTPKNVSSVQGERQEYEICYFLDKEVRGQGYMTEVVKSMKNHLFKERNADKLIIAIFPRNDSSRKVALKSGFTYERLEKEGGITPRNELVDVEFYTLEKEEYLNPGKKIQKEHIQHVEKQKWINESGILFPIPGYASLLATPGNGIFRIYENVRDKRLGLEKIAETFNFNFKIYDLDCENIIQRVIGTWSSKLFSDSNKNLGVIFNGLKGTGKTIAAKLLSNRMGLPVIVISKPMDGMLEFIQSLCFESVILIDEAEKTFYDDREVLLKMIDGVYNSKRKLYILTTNKLTVDENLLGRPGRIRYIKEFNNLSTKAVNDIIDDNLMNLSLKSGVLKLVDSLEISTIDILKSIIDECNIMGEVPSDLMLNVPKAKYRLKMVLFDDLDMNYHQEVQKLIKEELKPDETVEEWLMRSKESDQSKKNKDALEKKYDCRITIRTIPSSARIPYIGQHLNYGTVTSDPDSLGFFTIESDWSDIDIYCLINN